MTEWEPIDPGHHPEPAPAPGPDSYGQMAPVPWQPAYQPPRSNGSWRVVALVLSTVVAVLVTAVFVLTASNVTSGTGTALADTSKDLTVHNLPNGDVEVTYPAGHFRVTFPSEPTPQTVAESYGSLQMALHIAVVSSPSRTWVASVDLSRPLPGGAQQQFLRGAAIGFSSAGQFTLVSQGPETFQGHPGWKSHARTSSESVDILVFFASAQRAFMLIAPDGSAFDKLAASFVELH